MTMRPLVLATILATATVTAVSQPTAAQPAVAPAAVALDRPDRTLTEPFSFVRGVRELSNGKLLIADWIENRVVLADFGADACTEVIKEGPGPQELRLPIGLVRHRGDSTLLIDYGNNRVSVLDPAGRAAYSIIADAPGVSGVRGLTRIGELLFAIPAWSEQDRALPDDSVRIVRWDRASDSRRDVAVVQGTRMRKDRSPAMTPRIPTVGYASQDAWVVTQSGAIAIVRAAPYRIEVVTADGTRRAGPVVPVTRRQVTAADKRRYIREFSAGAMQSGRGENGGMGRAPAADEAEITRQLETTEFALEHPPFDAGAVFIDMRDRVWVGRPAVPGQPRHYDVFDLSGQRVLDVRVRAGRRITHVGAHGVYVVAEDDDGVQTIERYRLP